MRTYSKEEINAVADALQNHKIIALPTDTVYGVGVMYGGLKDLQRLKNAKHRPETKPIPMMVSSIEHMEQVAVVDERVKKIAERFLPGALTLVLKVKDNVPKEYTNGLDTIAVRIPDEPFILKVIDVLNTPLLVTSANQSGAKTALTSDDVFEQLPDIDGIVLGTCRALQASTIVDCTQEKLKILRPGPITLEQLEACW
ncbi:L-threonylcarbamoyladenylate synthase [Faecalicoccus pleomorphus]|uniref:L-threonylcarbamoyladenylate synthase n=1 Tax=Faecalicoccus pleomorphus TaxID=1323 RepID=UPI00242C7652|nr:L-threonylcarbamoyladenylate synthase [Faecalicoccus pleomorphus]